MGNETDGAIRALATILDLLPRHNLGYSFSFRGERCEASACDIFPRFLQRFVDRFFPWYWRAAQVSDLDNPSQFQLPSTGPRRVHSGAHRALADVYNRVTRTKNLHLLPGGGEL